jgi:hypothetical protein
MDLFSDSLARLKHQLRVSKDQEVAALLGIGKTAFSERKKRGSFPEREVIALSAARPDLGIDVAYVLTGMPSATHAAVGHVRTASDIAQRLGGTPQEQAQAAEALFNQMQPQPLASDEQMLLDAYRELDAAGKRKAMAFVLGGGPSPAAKPTSEAPTAFEGSQQVFHKAPKGDIAGRDIVKGGGKQ